MTKRITHIKQNKGYNMKLLTMLISFISLFTTQAFAHTDHALGEGSGHAIYHAVFWTVFTIVIYKAYSWFKNKNIKKNYPED